MLEKGSQLKGYIQREIKDIPMHSNYGYTYFFCRTFLERLYKSNPDNFILRGSYSQFANLKMLTRPLTDIDLVTFGLIEQGKDIVENTIYKPDKIRFEIKQKFVTTNATINYRIKCMFDNIQHLITLDLKKDRLFDSKQMELPKLFSQDKEFYVNAATLEEVIANKLYIVLLNLYLFNKLGKEFRRIKDFYDLQCSLELGIFDEDKVRELFTKKIKEDEFLANYFLEGNLFNKEFVKLNEENWNQDKRKYEFKDEVGLEGAVEKVNDFINKKR